MVERGRRLGEKRKSVKITVRSRSFMVTTTMARTTFSGGRQSGLSSSGRARRGPAWRGGRARTLPLQTSLPSWARTLPSLTSLPSSNPPAWRGSTPRQLTPDMDHIRQTKTARRDKRHPSWGMGVMAHENSLSLSTEGDEIIKVNISYFMLLYWDAPHRHFSSDLDYPLVLIGIQNV